MKVQQRLVDVCPQENEVNDRIAFGPGGEKQSNLFQAARPIRLRSLQISSHSGERKGVNPWFSCVRGQTYLRSLQGTQDNLAATHVEIILCGKTESRYDC